MQRRSPRCDVATAGTTGLPLGRAAIMCYSSSGGGGEWIGAVKHMSVARPSRMAASCSAAAAARRSAAVASLSGRGQRGCSARR
eukprot:scaffold819_cov105-Isochrysis_galbana.AAC.3